MSAHEERAAETGEKRSLASRVARKTGKVLLWILGVLAGLLALAWLALLIFFPDDKIKRMLVAELEERLGVQVRAESLDLNLFSGLSLEGIQVGPPDGFDRSPLGIQRLVVDYSLADLFGKKVTVRRLLIVKPEIAVIESGGRNNIAELIAQIGSKQPAEAPVPETPGEEEEGFVFDLEQVQIEDARVVLDMGPIRIDLAGVQMVLEGRLGSPSRTHLKAVCSLDPPQAPNFRAARWSGQGSPPIDAALGFALDVDADGTGRISAGGQVQLSRLRWGSGEDEEGHQVKLDFDANADLSGGTAVLKTLKIAFDQQPVATVTGRIDDLAQKAVFSLTADRLTLPIQEFSGLIQEWVPGLRLGGQAGLESVNVEGSLVGGWPRMRTIVALSGAGFALGRTQLAECSGKLNFGFEPQATGGKVSLEGDLHLERAASSGWQFSGIAMNLAVDTLLENDNERWLLRGLKSRCKATVKAGKANGLSTGAVESTFRLRVEDQQTVDLLADTYELPDTQVEAKVRLTSLSGKDLRLRSAEASTNLLLKHAGWNRESGWRAGELTGKLDVRAGRVSSPGLVLNRPRLVGDLGGAGLVTGGRFQRPLRFMARFQVDSSMTGPASFQSTQGRFGLSLAGARLDTIPAQLNLAVQGLEVRATGGDASGSTAGDAVIRAPDQVQLEARGKFVFEKILVVLEAFKVGIGDLVSIEGSGQFDALGPRANLDFRIPPFQLERVSSSLPAEVRSLLPRLSGEADLRGTLAGVPPSDPGTLQDLPFEADTTLFLRGVRIALPSAGVDLRGAGGQIRLRTPVEPGKLSANVQLTISKASVSAAGIGAGNLVFSMGAQGERGELTMAGQIRAGRLEAGGLLSRPLSDVLFEFESKSLGTKELHIKGIKLSLPSLGFDLDLSGRVMRQLESRWWEGLRLSGRLGANLRTESTVPWPGGISTRGQASLELSVETVSRGVLETLGKVSFAGLDVEGVGFALVGMRGGVSTRQTIAWHPVFDFQVKESNGKKSAAGGSADTGQSRAYDEALRHMKGEEQTFFIQELKLGDLAFEHLTANLELADGRLNLGSLRFSFLGGDVLADASLSFAPLGTYRLKLDAEMSGVDLAGLGALSLTGSSDIGGNLRLDIDWTQKVVSAAVNLTQIGRSTLQALLIAADPSDSNPGVMELRGFLNKYEVSPRRVSLDIRHGLLGMEVVLKMGITARTAARFIKGFKGETFPIKHLPVGGPLSKVLGF